MAADRHASVPKPLATGNDSEWFTRLKSVAKQMNGIMQRWP